MTLPIHRIDLVHRYANRLISAERMGGVRVNRLQSARSFFESGFSFHAKDMLDLGYSSIIRSGRIFEGLDRVVLSNTSPLEFWLHRRRAGLAGNGGSRVGAGKARIVRRPLRVDVRGDAEE